MMESTGDNILREYCENFETGNSSYVLPPLVLSKYPEERIPGVSPAVPGTIPKPSRVLTKIEENRLIGMTIEQGGEMAENNVFNLLHKLSKAILSDQFIALKDINLDNNNSSNVKEKQLNNELPAIDLSSVNMNGEHDFIVIIRNAGAIVMEVKTTAGTNIEKAEMQLKNSRALVQAVMRGVAGTGTSSLPVEKVMILPNELTPSPLSVTPENSHRIHRDLISQFPTVFIDIVRKLKVAPNSSVCAADFERFTRIMIGFWCLTPKKPGFVFNETLASTVSLSQEVDRSVDQQVISSYKESGKGKQPVSDVDYCPAESVSRKCKEIGAMFLTPQQKNILDNKPQALITGSAGTGKTLISLHKCVDIIEKHPNDTVLFIAPTPHNYRCQKILETNSIQAQIIKKFPPDEVNTSSVFIITLQEFFSVPSSHLFAYSLSSFHVFLDDVQGYRGNEKESVDFTDISKFVEKQYSTARQYNKHFWCCVDVTQGSGRTHCLGPCNIPIMQLNKVLRNSSNIIPVLNEARLYHINFWQTRGKQMPSINYSSVTPGHNISGEPVIYHQLKLGSDRQHCVPFVLQMIELELNILLNKQPAFQPSDVAILDTYGTNKDDIKQFVKKKFNIACHTIEESIKEDTNKGIVLDKTVNAMSYEVPCIISVRDRRTGSPSCFYVSASRARARLTVIDIYLEEVPRATKEIVTFITWEEQNGAFVKV